MLFALTREGLPTKVERRTAPQDLDTWRFFLLRWLAWRQASLQNLLSLRRFRPSGWGRLSEIIRPQCSQRATLSLDAMSQYICRYMAPKRLSNVQEMHFLQEMLGLVSGSIDNIMCWRQYLWTIS